MPFIYGPAGGVNVLSVPGGYTVMADMGITEANPETGPTASVIYKVQSADRYSFVQQLLGLWKGTAPSNVFYTGPYEYPASPNLLCTAVPSIVPFGKKLPDPLNPVGLPYLHAKQCLITAVFTRPPWQAATNQGYFSITFSAGGETLALAETTYQFGDGTPTATPVGIQLVVSNIIVTRYRMPFIPDAYSASLLGCVNNAPFGIGWNTYNTGTLLYMGMNSEIESDPLGNITFQLQYIFSYRNIPWNYEYHPNRTTGWAPVTDGNGNFKYIPANFNILP